jgi:hypothetical protein
VVILIKRWSLNKSIRSISFPCNLEKQYNIYEGEYFARAKYQTTEIDLSGRIDELSLRAAIRGGKIRRERFPLTTRYGK